MTKREWDKLTQVNMGTPDSQPEGSRTFYRLIRHGRYTVPVEPDYWAYLDNFIARRAREMQQLRKWRFTEPKELGVFSPGCRFRNVFLYAHKRHTPM